MEQNITMLAAQMQALESETFEIADYANTGEDLLSSSTSTSSTSSSSSS